MQYFLARGVHGAANNFSILEWFLYAFIWDRVCSWLVRVLKGDPGECMVYCLATKGY